MILGLALIESLVIYSLVISFMLLGKLYVSRVPPTHGLRPPQIQYLSRAFHGFV